MERIIYPDGLLLFSATNRFLVAFPHLDALLLFHSSPVECEWQEFFYGRCFKSIASAHDAPNGRINIKKHLAAFTAGRNNLTSRSVYGDYCLDWVLWITSSMVG